MGYLSNLPGDGLTPSEEIIIAQIANLGTPGQHLAVKNPATGVEWVNNTGGGGGDILLSSTYDPNAIGGILLSSHYAI